MADLVFDLIIDGEFPVREDRMYLYGTVTVDAVPAEKRVVIFRRSTHSVVSSTMSNASTGEWTIQLTQVEAEQDIFAICFDDTANSNAQIYDFVSQSYPPVEEV